MKLALKAASGLSRGKVINNVHSGGEEHRVSVQAGRVAQSDRQMCLTKADVTDQDDVDLRRDEVQTEQVLNLWPVDLLRPTPSEVSRVLRTGNRAFLIRRSMLRFSRRWPRPQPAAPDNPGVSVAALRLWWRGLVVIFDIVEAELKQLRSNRVCFIRVIIIYLVGLKIWRSEVDIEKILATSEL